MAVAVIGRIIEIHQIANADHVETAVVDCGIEGKWHGVVQKQQFVVGDLVEVYLHDALLPANTRFAFMERLHYLVKIRKFRGTRSECLIMPTTEDTQEIGCGINIESITGTIKYEKTLPTCLRGIIRGNFPTHLVPKTDEPNFQKVPKMISLLRDTAAVIAITQKCDGSSVTYYYDKASNHFGVCSRNLELKYSDNAQWQLANTYNIQKVLQELPFSAALQVEIVGPDIQKNRMGLKKVDLRAFTLYNIDEQVYLGHDKLVNLCTTAGIPLVPVLFVQQLHDWSDETLLILANQWQYPNGKPQEGIVIRPVDEMLTATGNRVSFKVINPNY